MQEQLYQVIRFYSDDRKSKVQKSNLTLKQAQEWCNDPETSSSTVSERRYRYGQGVEWFDGYNKQ